jgi:hypothetical protein
METVQVEIDALKAALHRIVREYQGDLSHPHVIRASQSLDRAIVKLLYHRLYPASTPELAG